MMIYQFIALQSIRDIVFIYFDELYLCELNKRKVAKFLIKEPDAAVKFFSLPELR